MCHSFVGTLLSPPSCSGEKGRLHECVWRGKINQYFLFIQFLVLIYSVFVCWEILSVDQWPTWWHYFASYRMTALSGAKTKQHQPQMGSLCTAMNVFLHLLGCVLWDSSWLSHSSWRRIYSWDTWCWRICHCQSCMLCPVTATVGLKAEKHHIYFWDTRPDSSPDVTVPSAVGLFWG